MPGSVIHVRANCRTKSSVAARGLFRLALDVWLSTVVVVELLVIGNGVVCWCVKDRFYLHQSIV